MKLILVLQLLILNLLVSCGKTTELSEESRFSSQSEVVNSRWPASAFPLDVKISNDFNNNELSTIDAMANAWTDTTKSTTTFLQVSASATETEKSNLNDYDDEILGIYKLTKWDSDLPATALAVTQIFGTRRGDSITMEHADILINYENYEFSTDGGFGYDLATVVLHEMGHFLGLYHESAVTSDESVMYPSISRFDIKRSPLTFDVSKLQGKYNFSYSAANIQNLAFNKSNNSADTTPVVLRLELNAQGHCTHKLNGETFYEH